MTWLTDPVVWIAVGANVIAWLGLWGIHELVRRGAQCKVCHGTRRAGPEPCWMCGDEVKG